MTAMIRFPHSFGSQSSSFINGSSTSFHPADVIRRNRSIIELPKVRKLTISFRAPRSLTFMKKDIPVGKRGGKCCQHFLFPTVDCR